MPKHSNCKNRSDNKPFFQMYKEMTKSQIFRKLSGNALKVLIDLMSQYNGNNNGMLIMPFNKSAELGISHHFTKSHYSSITHKASNSNALKPF